MDVTKENFCTLLPEIKSAISEATFLAIDCEFSGLNSEKRISPYDTYQQYYEKLKKSVESFLIFQFGLAIFRYDTAKRKFRQRCYNFYIFPRRPNSHLPEVKFLCQSSSIDFLARNDFNFNKVFKEGISYLNKPDELKYREYLDEEQKNRSNQNHFSDKNTSPVTVPETEVSFIGEIMKQIKEFISSAQEELILPLCNAFRRRLIYQEAAEKFAKQVELVTKVSENNDRLLHVLKPRTPEQKTQEEKLRCEKENSELEDIVGISRLIQHISESQKLVIGHNFMLDLLHVINAFMMPLPETYSELKKCIHCLFPKLLDTKVLASAIEFKEIFPTTVLNHICDRIQKDPFELPELEVEETGMTYNTNDKKEHEAGYDAFITGISFLAMSQYLGKKEEPVVNPIVDNPDILNPFTNKIFIMVLQDCPHVNLTGNDPQPSRDHVLHVTFPKEWKTNEITQLFSPFGNVRVSWLSDTSAYVALYKTDQASLALKKLSQSNTYSVISYAKHQSLLNTKITFTSSQVKRKREEVEEVTSNKKKKREAHTSKSEPRKASQTVEKDSSLAWKMSNLFDMNSLWE